MKPQALLVTLAVVAVLAAVPLAQGLAIQSGTGETPWPCCNSCGVCTRSFPPQCQCQDASPHGCHPECKSCDEFADDNGGAVFICMDRITNFCKNRCTPTAQSSEPTIFPVV